MKRSLWVILGVAFAANGVAMADVSLSGTLSGTDSNLIKDDGDGNHDYAIDRTATSTFLLSPGSPVSITGTVDVRNLAGGSYLQIGLVDKEQADLSLDTYNWGGYMFNNSAIATFYAGTRNYARLADNNVDYSAQLYNAPGTTAGVFDFSLSIASDGAMDLILHGTSDVSITYNYGTRNWWDGWSGWSGGELENGAYLIAQLWIDTGNTTSVVSADYSITANGTVVPAPGAVVLGMIGFGLVGWVKRRLS